MYFMNILIEQGESVQNSMSAIVKGMLGEPSFNTIMTRKEDNSVVGRRLLYIYITKVIHQALISQKINT